MKIFVGTTEIAGMLKFISSALRECGHEVTTCTDNYGATFYKYEYDIIMNRVPFSKISSNRIIRKIQLTINQGVETLIRRKVYVRNRDKYDVYIFIWNGFIKNDYADYEYLKKRGKKIITLFLGSDVRHVSAFTQEYQLDVSTWEKWFHTTDLNEQIFRLRKAELYSDLIFSLPDQAGLAIRPYHKLYIPFDAGAFTFRFPGRSVPKIVHIPSRTGIKGTEFVLRVLEELKAEGVEFEFEFITGVSNDIVLQKLLDADILVDEIYLHGPGTLSLEGMASGCAVATKTIENEIYDKALCNVNFSNLKEKLRRLITDIEYRKSIAVEGEKAVRTINNPVSIANEIINKLVSFDSNADDYYIPRFFSDSYILPLYTEVTSRNKRLTSSILSKFDLYANLNLDRMRREKLV